MQKPTFGVRDLVTTAPADQEQNRKPSPISEGPLKEIGAIWEGFTKTSNKKKLNIKFSKKDLQDLLEKTESEYLYINAVQHNSESENRTPDYKIYRGTK